MIHVVVPDIFHKKPESNNSPGHKIQNINTLRLRGIFATSREKFPMCGRLFLFPGLRHDHAKCAA